MNDSDSDFVEIKHVDAKKEHQTRRKVYSDH